MAVEINGDERKYPHFTDGQVLTHNDLNLLRDFLYTKSMFHARALLGFGVGCGLEGVLSGSKVEFSSGFALAQGGLELILPDGPAPGRTHDLATVTLDPAVYPFIDAAQAGRTAILRPAETVTAAGGACGAAGCATHTEQHLQRTEIVWVKGRLKLSTLQGDTAFTLKPIVPSAGLGGFDKLRDDLATYLTQKSLVDAATISLLKALKLDGKKGIDLLKVGIVNEVLYTLWDYLQCTSAATVPCLGEPGDPAVALGFASQTGATWNWDQRYRHYFRLSRTVARAISGYLGQDTCQRYLDHIRALLEDFTPPPPPVQNNDPVVIGAVEEATIYAVEIKKYAYVWIGVFKTKIKKGPPEPPDPTQRTKIFDRDGERILTAQEAEFGNLPFVSSYPLLGHDGQKVQTQLKNKLGTGADITVMKESTYDGLAQKPALGLMAPSTAGITLIVDGAGKVSGMAVTPAAEKFSQFAGFTQIAQQASFQAGEAMAATEQHGQRMTVVEGHVGDAQREVQQMAESIGAVESNLTRSIKDVRRELPESEKLVRVAVLAEEFENMGRDVRELQTRVEIRDRGAIAAGLMAGAPTTDANRALHATLTSIRTAIERSATQRQLTKVREALGRVEGDMQRLAEATEAGVLMTVAQPEALTAVLEGLSDAVAAAGVATNSVEFVQMRNNIGALRSVMGVRER